MSSILALIAVSSRGQKGGRMNYPSGYQPYPQYPAGVSAPGGGTAITAGVLACLGCIPQLFGGLIGVIFFGFTDLGRDSLELGSVELPGWYLTYSVISGAIAAVLGVALGVGGVALFLRKSFGRTTIVAACAVVIVMLVIGLVVQTQIDDVLNSGTPEGFRGISALIGGVGSAINMVFPIATAVLALLPATTRWLAYDPSAAPGFAGPTGYLPPYGNPAAGQYPAPFGDPAAGQNPGSYVDPAGQYPAPFGDPAAGQNPGSYANPAGQYPTSFGDPAAGQYPGSYVDPAGQYPAPYAVPAAGQQPTSYAVPAAGQQPTPDANPAAGQNPGSYADPASGQHVDPAAGPNPGLYSNPGLGQQPLAQFSNPAPGYSAAPPDLPAGGSANPAEGGTPNPAAWPSPVQAGGYQGAVPQGPDAAAGGSATPDVESAGVEPSVHLGKPTAPSQDDDMWRRPS